QGDGEHVELLGLTIGSAEAHRLDVVGAGDQPFADAVPDGQLEVVAGGAHGHPDLPPRHPQLQRLLHGQQSPGPAGPAPGPDLQDPALDNPPTRHRRLPSSPVPFAIQPTCAAARAPPGGTPTRPPQPMPTLAGTRWVPKNADSRSSTSPGRPRPPAL